jgi:protein phosphatase
MSAEKSIEENAASPPVEVELAALSHMGKVRTNNEDSYLVATFERSMKALLTSLPEGDIPHHYADTAYGLLVADGVGGAVGGEVASRTAISAIIELALRTPDWIMRLSDELANEVLHRLSERIKKVDAVLVEKAKADPSLIGMGTTMTITCSVGINLLIAHVGDSRAYMFRHGKLYRLTIDHTFAQALADAGQIGPEVIESHPMRHMLTHVVGSEGGRALADLGVVRLLDGDQILLCTDGLTDMVSETAIAHILTGRGSAEQTCQALGWRP